MAKKKKAKKKAPTRKNPPRRTGAGKVRRSGRRRRRNPGGEVSILSIVAGVVVGGVAAGATDYALAGTSFAATPTRRAVINGVVAGGLAVGAGMGSGAVRGFCAGSAGAFGGVAVANGARAVSVAMLASDDKKAVPPAKQLPAGQAADASRMQGVIFTTPRAAMRALVVDKQAAIDAARKAGVRAPEQLAAPRRVVPSSMSPRMQTLLVRGANAPR